MITCICKRCQQFYCAYKCIFVKYRYSLYMMESLTITISRKSIITKGQKLSWRDLNIKSKYLVSLKSTKFTVDLKKLLPRAIGRMDQWGSMGINLGPLDEWINVALAFEAVKTLKAFINMPIAALWSTVSNRNLARCRLIDIFFHLT